MTVLVDDHRAKFLSSGVGQRIPCACLSLYSFLYLKALSDIEGKGRAPPSDCDASFTRGGYAQGMSGLHSHLLMELCGTVVIISVTLIWGLPSEDSKCCANIFKISIVLLLINSPGPMFYSMWLVSVGLFLFV